MQPRSTMSDRPSGRPFLENGIFRSIGIVSLVVGLAAACSSSSNGSPPSSDGGTAGATASSDGGGGSGTSGTSGAVSCDITIVGCNTIFQNGANATLDCNTRIASSVVSGHQVCAVAFACDSRGCLSDVGSCLPGCSDAGATGGSASSGNVSGTGTGGLGDGGAIAPGGVGDVCQANTDCSTGLTCIKATDSVLAGGGPANGYCTFPCTSTADQSQCRTLGGDCFDFRLADADPPAAYCVQGCAIGDTNRMAKCHDRPDVACQSVAADPSGPAAAVDAACFPTCSQDRDCPSGRFCDQFIGVCVDTAPSGDLLGAHCDPNATTSTCAGGCLPLGDPNTPIASFCSSQCTFGEIDGCNSAMPGQALSSGGRHGICGVTTSDSSPGDVGFCVQECDTAADCADTADPGVSCDMTNQSIFGHGVCTWSLSSADAGVAANAPALGGMGAAAAARTIAPRMRFAPARFSPRN